MKVFLFVCIISWKMTQSALRFYERKVSRKIRTKWRACSEQTYKHERARMRPQRHPVHRLERPIRLHTCCVRKEPRCQTSPDLLADLDIRIVRAWLLSRTQCQTLRYIHTEPLKIPPQLISNADSSNHRLIIEEMIMAPFRFFFTARDECLVYVEQGKMIAFFSGEFPSSTIGGFLCT